MIGRELVDSVSFWSFLLSIDQDLAESTRRKACSCGGRLHCANYPRAPRGGPEDLPDGYNHRFSFCGGNETVGATETDGSLWRLGEPTGRNRQ